MSVSSTNSGVALTQDQRDLAEVMAAFVAERAPLAETRAELANLSAGHRTGSWDRLVAQGFHAVHLPEEFGGDGAGLPELAVITEALASGLFPGPFLSTVRAGVALASVLDTPEGSARAEALKELAAGATGVLVESGFTAMRADDGWQVTGQSPATVGIPGADVVLVQARTPDGAGIWFRLRRNENVDTAAVVAQNPTDLTRSVGYLRLAAHSVTLGDLLPDLPEADREHVRATLAAAESSGLTSALLDVVVEHLKSRHQFGRPLGSFQALQHQAALMLVGVETVRAAAWDAARATEADEKQRALATAQAALIGPSTAVQLALDAVSMLGAIGFTWEHDAHLYERRALALAGEIGPERTWATRLGELALTQHRDFSLVDPDDFPELRAEIGPILDQAMALPADSGAMTGWGPAGGGPRRELLAEAGLVSPHYPAPYGRNASAREQAVIVAEFAARDLPQPTSVIGDWVLPTLLAHGSEVQRERFMNPTLRGEIVWCQLFSEPGAGSDLASLRTRAVRTEGGWVLSGQKVWNSYAHVADWGVCLARTNPEVAKHAGISYFLIDMTSPGIEVRPIRQATGKAEFNEVFLDEVFVPDDCLVAEPGDGWRLAGTTLANERLNMGRALSHGGSDLLRRAINDNAHAVTRDEAMTVLGRNVSREMALSALALRGALARIDGTENAASASVQKVYSAIAQREGSRGVTSILGPALSVDSTETPYAVDYLGLPAVLFGGGTIEVQLNVIARRVLGLPGEPK